MTDCPQLSTRSADSPFLTKDNLYELIPSTFDQAPGTAVTVRCADGISLVGQASFICRADGVWSYSTKPYCTAQSPTTTEEDDGTTNIVVGVVCGVAALIVAILVIMLVVVYRRDKQFRNSQKSARSMTIYSGYDRGDPPTPYNYGYDRGDPPTPYNKSRFDRDNDRSRDTDRDRDRSRDRRMEQDSQLSNSIYLPRDPNETRRDHDDRREIRSDGDRRVYPEDRRDIRSDDRRDIHSDGRRDIHENRRDFHPEDRRDFDREDRRDFRRNENETPIFNGLKRPQVRAWVSRGTRYGDTHYMADSPRETEYLRQNPLLWRNSVLY